MCLSYILILLGQLDTWYLLSRWWKCAGRYIKVQTEHVLQFRASVCDVTVELLQEQPDQVLHSQ